MYNILLPIRGKKRGRNFSYLQKKCRKSIKQ